MRVRRNRRTLAGVVAGLGVFMGCADANGAQSRPAPRDAAASASGARVQRVQEEGGPPLADSALARLVDEILPRVERSAGVRATGPLNVAATDEGRLRAYITAQLATQLSDEEAAAITASYARLGLVPDSLDLRGLLSRLLEEQVVGYYDPVTDTLFVHERVTVEQLEPVLAHELVHALQDQHVALDSLGRAVKESNDRSAASQAAIEGHATFAMMEWQFSSMTGGEADLTQFQDLGGLLGNLDLSAFGDLGPVDVLARAPTVVREGLLFPYIGGVVFVQRLWKERPARPIPFGSELPRSTEQVLHVDRWLAGDEPTSVRFTAPAGEGWEVVYARDLGELETRIFLEEHLGDPGRAADAAAGWDGDAFRLYRGPAGEALAWVSVWDSDADAAVFADAVRQAYERRYADAPRRPSVDRETRDGRAIVRILDLPADVQRHGFFGSVELSGGADRPRTAGGK